MSGLRARGTALALAAALAGCSAAHKSRRLEGRYDLPSPGDTWRAVQPGGADVAWLNDALGASIYADSNCGVRYEDSDLASLAAQLTLGLEQSVEVASSELMIDGRSAYTRRVRGAMDGVPIELGATVLKKDRCVYDFVVIAPPSSFESAWGDFCAARDGFRTDP